MFNKKDLEEMTEKKRFEKEINLKELYIIIKKRFWIVILFVIIITILGSMYSSKPRILLYEASTRVFLQVDRAEMLNTVRVIIREPVVLEEVIKELNLNRSPEALRGQISVTNIEGSTVLRITVVDRDPELAAEIANSLVSAYRVVSYGTVFSASVIVLTEAVASNNPQPINPKSNRAVYLGFIAGIIIGIGVIFIIDSLDDTIRSEREIEQLLGIAVLGRITKIKRKELSEKRNKQKKVALRGETIGS